MNTELLPKLIGIPYLSRGRNPALGLDCWGLMICASRELFDHSVPDYDTYLEATDPDQVTPLFVNRHQWDLIELADAQPGDCLIVTLAGHPIHVGICLGGGKMLHTLAGRNSCIETYTASNWSRRIVEVRRWTGI